MDRIKRGITGMLLEGGFIQEKDLPICSYGIEIFLVFILDVGLIMLLSAIVGNFKETAAYLLFFMPVRLYAGGYHADTKLRCFLVLLGVYVVFSVVIAFGYFAIYRYAFMAVPAINLICVYFWAPVRNENKSITAKEAKVFKKKALILSCIAGFIVIISSMTEKYNEYSLASCLGLFSVIISMIAGKIKGRFRREV